MILKISLRAKACVPKTLVKRKFRLHSLYFPQNKLMLTESRGEFSDLHSIFRLRALRYWAAQLLFQHGVGFGYYSKMASGSVPIPTLLRASSGALVRVD